MQKADERGNVSYASFVPMAPCSRLFFVVIYEPVMQRLNRSGESLNRSGYAG
jgi:hypothetical protein